MTGRPFRFGVVATPRGREWTGTARRVAELGYSTLLMPDGLQLLAPRPRSAWRPVRSPNCASARSSSPVRCARRARRRGRRTRWVCSPAAGSSSGSAPELDGDRHTPVLVAAAGPRSLAFAAARADIVTLATDPLADRAAVAATAAELRRHAGERAGAIELAMNLFLVGDRPPSWTQRAIGVSPEALLAHDSHTVLRGSTVETADELRRRRDTIGVSYVCVNADFAEELAPVVERLTGH